MKRHLAAEAFALWCAALCCVGVLAAEQGTLEEVHRLEQRGQFKQAAAVLEQALSNPAITTADRQLLEFERDRLERIKKDFPFTKEALFAQLKKSVKGLDAAEFDKWVAEGRFDSREIQGTRRFMVSSVSNLFWRYPELSNRRTPRKITAAFERRVLESCEKIQAAAAAEHKPYVLPKQFEVTMKIVAESNAARAGDVVRAWLPIPRDYPFQHGFQLLSSSPAAIHIDGGDSSIRSVCLETRAIANQPTTFRIRYLYTAEGIWFDLDPKLVRSAEIATHPELKKYVEEAPHIKFTEEMRALSEKIAGTETNACQKARKFYEWIAENIQYSYSIEYSTIRNIGEYCRSHAYGDCGQEALLFMTLCRLNGIPARWQSGWNTFPGGKSIHDWSEIYLAPYGWVPVDPYMGIFAMRYANSLSAEQRRKIRDFYFGGLDQYRMAANSDHSQELSPPKRFMRSDTVDFQRGELEDSTHNIYLDAFDYELTIKEMKLSPRKVE